MTPRGVAPTPCTQFFNLWPCCTNYGVISIYHFLTIVWKAQSTISNAKLSPHPLNEKASAKEDDVLEEVVEKPQSLQKDLKVKRIDEEEKTKSAPDEKINSSKTEEKKKKKVVKKSSTHQKNGMQIFWLIKIHLCKFWVSMTSKHILIEKPRLQGFTARRTR